MTALQLRPGVIHLLEKVLELFNQPPTTDPRKVRSLTEEIIDAFDLMSPDEQSESFYSLLGLVWGFHGNLAQLAQVKDGPSGLGLSSLLKGNYIN